jgi:hypothetical protein
VGGVRGCVDILHDERGVEERCVIGEKEGEGRSDVETDVVCGEEAEGGEGVGRRGGGSRKEWARRGRRGRNRRERGRDGGRERKRQ